MTPNQQGMVERVAEAIYEAHRPSHHADWAFISRSQDQREAWFAIARAAIEAMREPTEVMLEPLFRMSAAIDGIRGPRSKADSYKCWQAMIDAALSEKT